MLKTGYFAYFSAQWGGSSPPTPPLPLATLLAFTVSLSAFALESPTSKIFQPVQKFCNSQRSLCGVVLQYPWVRSAFAIKLTETALRMRCEPTETAVRLWRMHGDCAANHIRYNGNDVVDCFVINFILRNNE